MRRCAWILLVLAASALAPCPRAVAEAGAAQAAPTREQRIEAAFLHALRLLEAGEPRRAAVILRAILADDPALPRVRLELARAYFAMQSWSEARAEFVTVLSGDAPEAVKRNILAFIRAIDARRGFDWSAAVGLSLNPEAARSYKTDTVFLDFFGVILPFTVEREDGAEFGATFEGSAEFRRALVESGPGGAPVVGFVAGAADIFDAVGDRGDDYLFSAATGVRAVWPQTTASLALNASLRQQGGDLTERRAGLSGTAERRFASGFTPFATASFALVDNRETDDRDGGLATVGAGFSQSFLGVYNLGASATAERFDADAEHEAFDALALSVFGSAEVAGGYTVSARASYRRSEYRETAPLFLDRRTDEEFSVDVEVVKNDLYLFDAFSPFVQAGYTKADSSIGIFSYDEFRVFVGLKNAF